MQLRLEDYTKEELIHIIKQNCLCSKQEVLRDVLIFRLNKLLEKQAAVLKKSNDTLSEATSFAEIYEARQAEEKRYSRVHKKILAIERQLKNLNRK